MAIVSSFLPCAMNGYDAKLAHCDPSFCFRVCSCGSTHQKLLSGDHVVHVLLGTQGWWLVRPAWALKAQSHPPTGRNGPKFKRPSSVHQRTCWASLRIGLAFPQRAYCQQPENSIGRACLPQKYLSAPNSRHSPHIRTLPDASQPDQFILQFARFDDQLFSPQLVTQAATLFDKVLPLSLQCFLHSRFQLQSAPVNSGKSRHPQSQQRQVDAS